MPHFTMTELAEWTEGTWAFPGDVSITGIGRDTRALQSGDLYVALKGEHFDGHDFVLDALNSGASAAMVNKGRHEMLPTDVPVLMVDDTLLALQDIAQGYREKLNPVMIGVTGSVGKSSVKDYTADMLQTQLPTARTLGNWNNEVGLPLSLLAMERATEVGVFELGMNHPGEIAERCRVLQPVWGIVTNIGPVHLEHFGSVEAIAEEKAALLRALPSRGGAVLNRDSECFGILRSAAPANTMTISLCREADYCCSSFDDNKREALILESSTGETCTLTFPLPGKYQVANALMAIAVARAHKISWENIARAVEAYTPLPMRWQESSVQGVQIINDAYNANPMSMRVAIQTFAQSGAHQNSWLLLGDMLELGSISEHEHKALGQFLAQWDWKGIVVVGALGALIADGAETSGFEKSKIYRCSDTTQAAHILKEKIIKGDSIFLKASRGLRLEKAIEEWQSGRAA